MMTIPMDNNLDIQSRERVQRLFNKSRLLPLLTFLLSFLLSSTSTTFLRKWKILPVLVGQPVNQWRSIAGFVELKTFEISLDIVKGKEVGKILERGKGFSSWIKVWKKGGTVSKLELHNNKVGRFLLSSALNKKEKRFSLVFPEGKKEFLGDWKILASKLRSIGIAFGWSLKVLKEFVKFREEKVKNGGDVILNLASFAKLLKRSKGGGGGNVD
ncbi:hypothetical protein CK203_027192 [Vitis vinifera]|uniref:Uncharacterized protein n=1 Tax=Vitis vinifera TaxID=29760 RepID=A0A438I639_VITVI|nr:hypothetical protein CK203_027192 [Vitis vinifera]